MRGRSGWHGNAMISILIVCIAFLLTFFAIARFHNRWKARKECAAAPTIHGETGLDESRGAGEDDEIGLKHLVNRVKSFVLFFLLPLTFLLLVITEVAFALVIPTASILPLRFLGQDAIASSPEGGGMLPGGCDVEGQMEIVQDFFQNSTILDFDRIRVVVGGRPVHFTGDVAGQVVDETIHLAADICPSTALLVHETVHVWQFQSGWWFGSEGLRRAVDYLNDYRKCIHCLYDYGGLESLRDRMDKALDGDTVAEHITLAFGAEQMAMIVEDYYYYFYEWGIGSEYYDGYFAALKFYAEQIVEK